MIAQLALLPHFLAEVCGTAAFMFIGCTGYGEVFHMITNSVRAFTFGLGLQFSFEVFGSVSSGHFNPAVSIGVTVLGKIEFFLLLLFLMAQYIGALLGYMLIYKLIPLKVKGYDFCVVKPPAESNNIKVFLLEALMTAGFVMATASLLDSRNLSGRSSPMRMGLLYAGLTLIAMPYSGGGLNPARTLIPQLITKNYKEIWIYQCGPFLGGIVGAFLYRFLFDSTEHNSLYNLLSF